MKTEKHTMLQIKDIGKRKRTGITFTWDSRYPDHVRLGDGLAETAGHDHVWIRLDGIGRVGKMLRKTAKKAKQCKR